MLVTRVWAMPNPKTFSCKPIGEFVNRYISALNDGAAIIDPFANGCKLGTVTNDLNPEFDTDYHMDALAFLKMLESGSADAILYDPPYSVRQASECYANYGTGELKSTITNWGYWSNCKKEVARILKVGGIVLSFGWNSNGIGMSNGMEMDEVLIVAHGGAHNDTICVAEHKVR